MGKKQNEIQKIGLGRAQVKQHNQMIQQGKDKSRFYRKKFLESFTEVFDINVVVKQSLEPLPELAPAISTTLISLEPSSVPDETTTSEEVRKQQKQEEALHTSSLRVPCRPPWTPDMSADELNTSKTQAFLTWRRSLVRLEENKKLVLTPFEKNLDIWRQLWRVVERSDLLCWATLGNNGSLWIL
ncbi:hypothetical protein JHK85_019471 [Glycine max]|nr:hypothetical protein JHK85_019471 [Glycine max]KAG5038211.1 hypothetical protein JHK86_019051 [Glycine max]